MITTPALPQFKSKFSGFHDLMKFRVREILLVSSLYDAFVLEEDGRLADRIFSEYIDLNLHFIPRITKVATAEEAFQVLERQSFDLVITMTRIADMNPVEFGQHVKQRDPDKTVVLLTYDPLDPLMLKKIRRVKSIDRIFYWFGDSKLLLAIIKYVEDMKNAREDVGKGIQIILLVEDSPKYTSLYLPSIYAEIMTQTRNLIADGVNTLHRLLRMRARPKILLAENYEDAVSIMETYQHNILGIICDLRFPKKGKLEEQAGFQLAAIAKKTIPDLPILIQSADLKWQEKAFHYSASFLDKNSPNLLLELRSFIIHHFGFGDFVFRQPGGGEVCRARNLTEFAQKIKEIPAETLDFHATRNHFSIWLRARTEFELADELRPKQVSDFNDVEGLRHYIHSSIHQLLQTLQRGVIKDFSSSNYYTDGTFIQLGSGSLGGKGRGIAFINAMLADNRISEKFPDVDIKIPQTFVMGTEIFEEFIERNDLQEFAIRTLEEKKINKKFLASPLPSKIVDQLRTFLDRVKFPLAVRSSSLLEDSQLLPFAGLYKTFMLSNTHQDLDKRLQQLLDAIRLIYASVYHRQAKEYVKNTDYRIEEEKMGVVIQQCVGLQYGSHFYPVISGVAQSYNFYPLHPMEPEEGIIHLALGLGKIIMDGERIYRFSPKHPQMNLPYASTQEFIENSQNKFYALNLTEKKNNFADDENSNLIKFDISQAEQDGSLFFVGSTYSPQDQTIQDTLSFEGPRLVTFANILKYKIFPLPEVINEILDIGVRALGTHVEIEFCLNLFRDPQKKPEMYILQIRPMVAGGESFEVTINQDEIPDSICYTNHAIGNGTFENVQDIIFVNPDTFDIAKTDQIALEIEKMNHLFIEEQKKYVLIGFGRWGTSDPWLGIPTNWYQVCGAQVIIESFLGDLKIEPSQGSHFFHNLVSLRLGYFYIKDKPHPDFIDWQWLQRQKPYRQTEFLKHLHFREPLNIKIHGKTGQGIIYKPKKNKYRPKHA